MADLVARARDLAHRAHAGQVDKAGRPYIEHVARVAAAVSDDPVVEAVAWVHDILEDCPAFHNEFWSLPARVTKYVHYLTRSPGWPKRNYYERITEHQIALRVKLADIADNADEARLALLDTATADRLRRKYQHARKLLGVSDAPEVGEG